MKKDITVNDKSLDEYLDEEKTKEVVYDVRIQVTKHSLYKRPSDRYIGGHKARSGKVIKIYTEEDLFMHAFDALDEVLQDKMANATRRQQDKVWYKWKKATKTWPLSELLSEIIKEIL